MKFTVYIKNWARGGKGGKAALLNSRKMCCLGFAALECGFTKAEIRGKSLPDDLVYDPKAKKNKRAIEKAEEVLFDCYGNNTRFSERAAAINDDKEIDDRTRMGKLRKLAQQFGHRFIFSAK